MDPSLTTETLAMIGADFSLPAEKSEIHEQEAIELIAKAIRVMLDRDFERLLQICYRIDLGENKLKKILHESAPDFLALDLAEALWNRQKLKVEIRRKYS